MPGGCRGLQNRCRRVQRAGVGSIPSLSAESYSAQYQGITGVNGLRLGSVPVAASSGKKRQFAAKNRYKTDTTLCLVFPSKPGEIPPKRPVSAQGVPFPGGSRFPLPVPVAFKAQFRMPADALKWDHGYPETQ